MYFDWDDCNRDKNLLKHGVHDWEVEEAFEDRRRIIERSESVHGESRFLLLARCRTSGKYLRVVYTVRERGGRKYFRPISAVEMPKGARSRYERRK